MISLNELLNDETIKEEYKKSFLLNMFQKICSKMDKDEYIKTHIRQIYRESFDKVETTKNIIKKHLNYELSQDEAECMLVWFEANFRKKPNRKTLALSLRQELVKKQNGRCAACGEQLNDDLKKIHIDHIIPWKLVGDELKDNFQALCETCNECKSAKTDYIFRSLIKLV